MQPCKRRILEYLRHQVAEELAAMENAQRGVQDAVTHEEARPENDKDTRALEQSYLARGQAKRVIELRDAKSALDALVPRDFGEDDPIATTALVRVAFGDEEKWCFIVPTAVAGTVLELDGHRVSVLSVKAPLGRVLLGKRLGDDVDFETPTATKEGSIVAVA